MALKLICTVAGIAVFLICLYSFLLGSEVFDGHFKTDPMSWYFLAKGIFCGIALYLLADIIEILRKIATEK